MSTTERAYRSSMARTPLRPLRADDLAEVCALTNRTEVHDGVARVVTVEELAEELDDDHVVLATDTRAVEVDGRLAGYVYTYHLPSDVGEERCYLFGHVDPLQRGAGLGRELLTWGIERAREQLHSSGSAHPKWIRVSADVGVESAHRLYARLGFTPVRWFEDLLRPLDHLPERGEPDGVRIIAWPDDRDEEILRVKNAAFEDHWGSTPASPANWQQMTRGFGARLDLSFVALDAATGDVVAYCLCKRFPADDELLGRRDAWIDNLGTLRESGGQAWRGRGIASALIAHALHAFAAADLTHASIGVDSDSPTGAAALYRALGFEPVARSTTHQIGA